jgi:DNA-binding NarL/FixJ family response regulator
VVDGLARVTNVGVFIVEVPYRPIDQIPFEQAQRQNQLSSERKLLPKDAICGLVQDSLAVTSNRRPSSKLSPREREILQLLASGKSNKEIGWELKISVKTGETYRTRLMLKLEAPSLV